MENGETIEQAAARETWEEACANVGNLKLYTLFDLPHINQVYMLFLGELVGGSLASVKKAWKQPCLTKQISLGRHSLFRPLRVP